jgi:hypothetical protein
MTIWLCTECHREWVDPDDPPVDHECYPAAESPEIVKLVPDGGSSVVKSAVNEGQLRRGQHMIVQQHAHVIAELPRGRFHGSEIACKDPTVEVPYADFPHDLKLWHSRGILSKVERRSVSLSSTTATYFVWRVPEEVHDYAESYLEQLETAIPGCPHTGVRNVPQGGYTCCDDDCDNEVPREEVRKK